MIDNPIGMVRQLKGAPLSIFFALAYQRTRVSQGWLCGVTGYTDKPVQQALAYLAEIGLVNHTSSGWQLTRGAVQLPLPVEQLEEVSPNSVGAVIDIQENSDTSGGSRNNSDSLLVSLVNTESINHNDSNKLTNNEKRRKNSDVWQILEQIGVKQNRSTMAICELPWVDSESVQAMIEKLEGEGRTWPRDCGLLLYRLRQKPTEIKHKRDCRCEVCDAKGRARYAKY